LNYVLDACALLALLKKEPGQEIIKDLLGQAESGKIVVSMSIVNLIEVFYGFIGELGKAAAQTILETVYTTPIKFINTISQPVFEEASRLKGTYKMSIADAIGVATASDISGTFVTSDHSELEEVEKNEPIPFLWLPPRPRK
jgi:predicted nucleic acid-binding protein